VALVLGTAACVTTTTRWFLRSEGNPLYTPTQAEPVVADYLRLQCPAMQARQLPDTGSARLVIDVDSGGVATRAQLVGSAGDELLDGILGTVGAQLRFPVDSTRRSTRVERLRVTWRCAGDSTAVHVVPVPR
jgi:hypothetical protein